MLEPSEDDDGIIDHIHYCDGEGANSLRQEAGGSLNPASHETVDKKMHFLYQDGKPVFKAAVTGMADVSYEIMERNGLTGDDVAWLVPHQANLRIIKSTAKKMSVPMEKVVLTVQDHGNTSAASIPLALSVAVKNGKIKKNDLILTEAIGGGLAWGAVVFRW